MVAAQQAVPLHPLGRRPRCCPRPGAAAGVKSRGVPSRYAGPPGRRGFEPYCVVCGSQDYGGPHDLPRVRSVRESGTAGPLSRCRDLLRQLLQRARHPALREWYKPGFPILGVFRLKGQPKRDGSIIVRSCKASQSPVNPIRDAILAVNHVSCPSLSSSGPRQWGESALKRSRLPGALSLLARSWLYPPSAWRRR